MKKRNIKLLTPYIFVVFFCIGALLWLKIEPETYKSLGRYIMLPNALILLIVSIVLIYKANIVIHHDLPYLCDKTAKYGEKGVAKLPANTADEIPFSWRFDFGGVSTSRKIGKEVAAIGFETGKLYIPEGLVFRYRLQKKWHSIDELSYKQIHYLRKSIEYQISNSQHV